MGHVRSSATALPGKVQKDHRERSPPDEAVRIEHRLYQFEMTMCSPRIRLTRLPTASIAAGKSRPRRTMSGPGAVHGTGPLLCQPVDPRRREGQAGAALHTVNRATHLPPIRLVDRHGPLVAGDG